MKRVCLVLTSILACLCIIGCTPKNGNDNEYLSIAEIHYWRVVYGILTPEYKVDIESGKLWYYTSPTGDPVARDETLDDDGYTLVRDLTEEEISAFLYECQKSNLLSWKESYVNNNVSSGFMWHIVITFTDGTTKETGGSNKTPSKFDVFYDALHALTHT